MGLDGLLLSKISYPAGRLERFSSPDLSAMDSSSPSVSPTSARRSLTRGSDLTVQLNDTQSRTLHTPPTIHSYLNPNRQVGQQHHSSDVGMDPETSPRTQEHKPGIDDDDDEFTPGNGPEDCQFDRESSSESLCLRRKRPLLQVESAHVKTTVPGKPRPLPGNVRSTDHDEINREQPSPQRGTVQSLSTAKTPATRRKKPGPRPWVTKLPKKNDMALKMQVISEIEEYWGKNFITAYIPKCHRPLVKSTKGKKRRSHESNPKNWLPSILKAILALAKLTQNKAWLKKAINDVVRYRIKHTGNRKPQLTTTDFDVLEDMLARGWKISYSFPIRYKHLLVKGENEQVNDEDIDNILGVRNRSELGNGDKGRSDDDYSTGSEDDETDEEESGEANEDEQQTREFGLSDNNLQHSGYADASQDVPPASVQQRLNKTKLSKRFPSHPKQSNLPSVSEQQALYGYCQPRRYEAPNNPWGHPMQGFGSGPVDSGPHDAHNGYGSYGSLANYNGYGGYGFPGKDGRNFPQQWGQHVMNQWAAYHPFVRPPNLTGSENGCYADTRSAQLSPSSGTPHCRESYPNTGSDSVRQSLELHGYTENFTDAQCHSTNYGEQDVAMDDACGSATDSIDDETAVIEAELRATELELKVAQLKAKRAAMKLQSKAK